MLWDSDIARSLLTHGGQQGFNAFARIRPGHAAGGQYENGGKFDLQTDIPRCPRPHRASPYHRAVHPTGPNSHCPQRGFRTVEEQDILAIPLLVVFKAEDILDFIQSQFSTLLFYYNAGDIVVVILSFHGNSTFPAFWPPPLLLSLLRHLRNCRCFHASEFRCAAKYEAKLITTVLLILCVRFFKTVPRPAYSP